MEWSPEQKSALAAIQSWLSSGRSPVFRAFGYAGTGKTTLARIIAAEVKGDVVFAAFTGTAASVMRAKGCAGATTIHSLIYRTSYEDGRFRSVLNPDSQAATVRLIIDECSMVDEKLGTDLLSFGRPILVLGDPEQLPAINGTGFFTEAKPDIMLTEIHRQAAENPIVCLASDVRLGKPLQSGSYGESRVTPARRLTLDPIALSPGSRQKPSGRSRETDSVSRPGCRARYVSSRAGQQPTEGAFVSIGLIALLDDVAGLAKVAAASLDDVAGQLRRRALRLRAS